jgi:hypothetical protein
LLSNLFTDCPRDNPGLPWFEQVVGSLALLADYGGRHKIKVATDYPQQTWLKKTVWPV